MHLGKIFPIYHEIIPNHRNHNSIYLSSKLLHIELLTTLGCSCIRHYRCEEKMLLTSRRTYFRVKNINLKLVLHMHILYIIQLYILSFVHFYKSVPTTSNDLLIFCISFLWYPPPWESFNSTWIPKLRFLLPRSSIYKGPFGNMN